MKVDCLIVGSGLAGLCFAETLFQKGHSFVLISDDSQQASEVAGGLYNPLILKCFTLAFKAAEQLDLAMPFYQAI
ncbi:MAG: FAD-binding protein, partial [Flavobacteriaceae bacterium]